ncbi:MFS transporter, partial [Aeromonas dhakensis]
MLSFMRSAPPQLLIHDQAEIDACYRHWRLHILLTMYLGYAVFYFTRKSFNFAMPDMLASGMLAKADIGMLWTLFYITYGCSKFFSGIISDRANPRYFMGLGLMATGVINILFGLSSSLWLFAALWVANAFFQGWGWPPCSKLLTSWYSRSERGFWWSAWNTAHNVGGALIPLIVSTLALQHGWRYGMIVPGLIAIVAGLFLCWRLRDTPSAMGLPTVGEWRSDALELAQQTQDAGLSHRQILRKYVLGNPYIWLLACCYVLVYVVRTAINDWGNLYMTEQRGFNLMSANSAISMFEVGG